MAPLSLSDPVENQSHTTPQYATSDNRDYDSHEFDFPQWFLGYHDIAKAPLDHDDGSRHQCADCKPPKKYFN